MLFLRIELNCKIVRPFNQMGETKLYKYLDADGGLMMLYYSTLMFTNATQLNDPFDCHPAFRDLSSTPDSAREGVPGNILSQIEYNNGLRRKENAYVCSLSKVYDSILMWSYYNRHSGICIGLDMEKTRKYLNRMMGLLLGCAELEVEYRDVINETHASNFLSYYFATKAKEWQHEQEIRLVSYDPSPMHMRLLPGQYEKNMSFCKRVKHLFNKWENEDELMDWKEVRAFLDIGGECFDSLYLGVKLNEKKNKGKKEIIIKAAKKCNPNIKIYQMTIDPKAFRLKEELVS